MECHGVYQPHSREGQGKTGQHIMNSTAFIADMDLEFCHESTFEDVYQRTGIF